MRVSARLCRSEVGNFRAKSSRRRYKFYVQYAFSVRYILRQVKGTDFAHVMCEKVNEVVPLHAMTEYGGMEV